MSDRKSLLSNLKTEHLILAGILLVSFALNLYGINWGLPARWNVDQSVTPALNMLRNENFSSGDYIHPSFYYYVLIFAISPFLVFKKLFYTGFDSFLAHAKISWNYMALHHPEMASGIFISARMSSVIFSVLTVFVLYKIGKVLHSRRAGLFSALILTLTMDFVNWAHMTKRIPLLNLLIMVSFYYAFLVFKKENVRRNFLLCSLYGGIACSTKFNGGITFLLIPIIALWQFARKDVYVFSKDNFKDIIKIVIFGTITYAFIFFLSSPNILIEFGKYYFESTSVYKNVFIPEGITEISRIWIPNIIGLLNTLVRIFGLSLSFIVGCGFFYTLFKYFRNILAIRILVSLSVLMLCLFALAPRIYISPDSKYIVQIVPFLAILGGIFLADLISGKILTKLKKYYKTILIVFIFSISFFYCVSLNGIFASEDLRYYATNWIISNVPKGSVIIFNNQLEYSMGIKVLEDYNVYVLASGTKGAYSFLDGRYNSIDRNKFQEIKKLSPVYVVRSGWWAKRVYVKNPLDGFPEGMKLVKRFQRNKIGFWVPDAGGYEPGLIEIYVNNMKE